MMDARRWNQICVEFDGLVAASDVQRDDRVALLATTDPTLRAAVEQLLRADAEADVRLFRVESPFGHEIRPDASSPPGCSAALQSQLRRALEPAYRLQRELGGGGMSYVFVAEEIAVKRRVVIKMLRPELAEAISMKRFQREIELAANLQHPHIVPLLSAGIADGLLYYTMPLVAGESLRDRLKRENEIPVADTVRILRDVCAALAYAHARGIVHRDIKPANVLLSEGGALVTDFGIAKALRSSRSPGEAVATTTGITDRGLAIGTPRYMAPEQAIDSPDLDHRADLYALGAVAYEMLAGCPPFAERSSQRLLVAHALEAPAPIGARRPSIPTPLAELVMRCLAKQPADRPQSAHEIGALLNRLEGLRVQTPTVEAARARRSRGKFRPILRVLVAAAVVLGGVASGNAIATRRRSAIGAPAGQFRLVLPDSAQVHEIGELGSVAVSPAGSALAYIGTPAQAIFVRRLNDRRPRRLAATEGAACPVFSPDGRWIAFISRQRLRKIAVQGSVPFTLADSAAGCPIVWSERDELLFNWRGPLFRVRAEGGPVFLVTRGDSSERVLSVNPSQALPGGKAVLACIGTDLVGTRQLGVISLPQGRIKRLTGPVPAFDRVGNVRLERCPAQYANGHVLFTQNRTLFARPFSLRALEFTGPEVPVIRDSVISFSSSPHGILTYVSAGAARSFDLVAVDETGQSRMLTRRSVSERGDSTSRSAITVARMPLDTGRYAWPRLSPDGKRVVMELFGGAGEVLWVYGIESGTLSRLNTRSRGIQPTGWTGDGREVIYVQIDSGDIGGPRRIVSQPWDGTGPPRELLRFPPRFSRSIHTLFDLSIGPPHTKVAFVVGNFSETADIWIAPLDSPGAARPMAETRRREYQPRLSPDGQLLAYTTDETGAEEVKVRSLDGSPELVQVSTAGGAQPIWSRDGRGLFYRQPRSERAPGFLMRATIARSGALRVTRRDTLFRDVFYTFDVANYDVFPGDRELLLIRPNPPAAHVTVVLDWPQVLLRQHARD